NLSATAGRARDRELRADTGGAFAHALQPEMPFFASTRRGRVHAAAVIGDANAQVLRVGESHLDAAPSGVRAGVANRLIGDSIDLVTNDGMYFSGLARHGKRGFCQTCRRQPSIARRNDSARLFFPLVDVRSAFPAARPSVIACPSHVDTSSIARRIPGPSSVRSSASSATILVPCTVCSSVS